MTLLALGISAAQAQSAVGPSTQAVGGQQTSASQPASPIEARIDGLLSRMSLEHKIAQLIQPDISTITPEDVRRYRFGSVLNGGNSGPGGDDKAPASAYLALADAFWAASTAPLDGGEPAIPLLWATDAVHGDNNIIGATLFPHNVALGAANDPALMHRIGEATATEIATTGLDWAFAPTLAVARDTRWGRSYESLSEEPAVVTRLGTPLVEGLQGKSGTAEFLDQHHVLATLKHFFGDGGTGGVDRGDTRGDLDTLIGVHAAAYRPAIAAGAQTVMASFSSINGEKMHGNQPLLTGLLRGEMHFDGLVVGDWNGHGLIPGCTNSDCPKALLAGLDIFMVPEDWRKLYESTLREARDGTIPMARIDEAVRRVLRVKLRYGLFDKPRPSGRELAGKWDLIGSADHRAIAREAVRKSLVLLKNDAVLPIRASANVLVAGKAADSVARQAGGWSISWQGGGGLTNADFPGATSIFAGIAEATREAGGHATLSVDGAFANKPDVAVVVFGEEPYAEYVGDRPDHALQDEEGLALLRKFKAAHVPTVAVLLSGRPLWVGRELAAADAFVAAWLPGSEGAGVADVLVGDANRNPRQDFTGRLSFHWPADCLDAGTPLVVAGGGGSYRQPPRLPALQQACGALRSNQQSSTVLFKRALGAGVAAFAKASSGQPEANLPGLVGLTPGGAVAASAFDLAAQEDGRQLVWSGPGEVDLRLSRPLPAKAGALTIEYAIDQPQRSAAPLGADCDGCRPVADLSTSLGKGWQTLRIPLHCFGRPQFPGLRLRASGATTIRLAAVLVDPTAPAKGCRTGH